MSEAVNAFDVANAQPVPGKPRTWESIHKERCPHGRFVSARWRVTVDHDGPPTGEEWSSAEVHDQRWGCRICIPPEE